MCYRNEISENKYVVTNPIYTLISYLLFAINLSMYLFIQIFIVITIHSSTFIGLDKCPTLSQKKK